MPNIPMWRRYARLLGADPTEDVRDELGFHLQAKVDDLVSRGWEEDSARAEAERQFGDIEGVKTMGEQLGRERAEREHRREYWNEIVQDVRFGLRMMRKQLGFTAIAVLTLALGIGATTAVLTLIQGVLLTPPPYRQPEQLMIVSAAPADGRKTAGVRVWPAGQWLDWQKQSKTFDGIAGYTWAFTFLVRQEGSESLEGMVVSTNFFDVTGLRPILGRTFLPTEGTADAPRVMMIGYDLWQRSFHGDPKVIGTTAKMNRQQVPFTIVGVMPPGIRFLPSPRVVKEPNYDENAQVDFWQPAIPDPSRSTQPFWDVVGRLRPGVTRDQAQSELAVLTTQQGMAEREYQGFTPNLTGLDTVMNGDGERILFPLLGAAALVFMIACGNVAALLLVRGLQRQQEYAVRGALGGGRAVLFRQVSTESLLLAFVGGGLGVALAVALVKIFKLAGGHAVPRLDSVVIGWPVLAWGFGAAVAAALAAGLLPALRASQFDLSHVLKSGGPKSSAGRGERGLLQSVTVVQIAMTLALLAGAGLLVRTMKNLSAVESGYDTSRILTMSVTAVLGDWDAFHKLALQRVSAVPGVEAAAFAWGVPLTGNNWQNPVEIEGQPVPTKPSERIVFPVRAVTPGYFSLLRLPIREGRDFRDSDEKNAPLVAIVNRAFADTYFASSTPMGRKLWKRGRGEPPMEIVAVVENGRTDDLTRAAEPEIYTSLWQNGATSKHLVVRSTADPRTVMAAVQAELRGVDPTVSVENIQTLDQIRDDSLASRSFAMQLLAGFSVIASVLTLVGIYGVSALSVAARRRELAIRAAVGAERSDIRNLIVRESVRLVGGGVVAGLVAAFSLAQLLRTFLYGVEPTDPITLLTVAAVFAIAGMVSTLVPIRRAMRVAPLEALRGD